jgi:hypothetical protein
MGIKNWYAKKKAERKESKAFHSIVEKNALLKRRQAYAKEAERQAELKGKKLAIQRANRPTFGQKAGSFAKNVAKKLAKPPRRTKKFKPSPIKSKPQPKVFGFEQWT